MPVQIESLSGETLRGSSIREAGFEWPRSAVLAILVAVFAYLCWRIVTPFLPAFCWAFALALVCEPFYQWIVHKLDSRGLSSALVVLLVIAVIAGPGAVLVRAVAVEAADVLRRAADPGSIEALRRAANNAKVVGPVLKWLDSHFDLQTEMLGIARSLGVQASTMLSALLTGSIRLLSQIAVTMFALFYFLRDGETIVRRFRSVLPLKPSFVDRAFSRIAQMIRVSLGGKLIVAMIQGALGGLMFFWLGLPAPVFWGSVMALLSVFPVIGGFIIWGPAALILALEGDWPHALLLAGWGILVIHPVDNLLGPVLVGATLHLHTLATFVGVLGGIAAFGAAGVVLGPVVVAITAAVLETPVLSLDSQEGQ